MRKIIDNYRALSFEERTLFNTRFSIIFNIIMAISKFVIAIFYGVFFFVTGVLNIFILISKLQCYLGVKAPNARSFRFRNNFIGIFLILAGLQYTIYMSRLIYSSVEAMSYSMLLGIMIALVSFIEMGVAIKGCFNAFGKGHYFRNIKLINLCSAFTAMVLTEVAIMSFASETPSRELDAIFGVCVGAIIILIGIYVLIAPRISIVDRKHNVYRLTNDKGITDNEIEIILTNSRLYGNYTYIGQRQNDVIDGYIIKGKSPIVKWNIYIKIVVIILSEILIFGYAVGALVFHFKNSRLIYKLDNRMSELGYEKLLEEE